MERMRFRVRKILLILLVLAVVGLGSVFAAKTLQPLLVELTGILKPGVEAGCIILETADTPPSVYNLLDVPPDHPPFGSSVRVLGHVEENVTTFCMQGTAFRVVYISAMTSTTVTVTTTETVTVLLPRIDQWLQLVVGVVVAIVGVLVGLGLVFFAKRR